MDEHPRRFHAYLQHVEGGDVLSMLREELDAALSDTEANPVPVDITKIPCSAVARDAAVIACVAEREADVVTEVRVYRDDPKDAVAYANRAALRAKKGNEDGALRDYDTAVKLNPDYGIAYQGRATVHRMKRDPTAAARDTEKAIACGVSEKKLSGLHVDVSRASSFISADWQGQKFTAMRMAKTICILAGK